MEGTEKDMEEGGILGILGLSMLFTTPPNQKNFSGSGLLLFYVPKCSPDLQQ